MTKAKSNIQESIACIFNPETEKLLGRILIIGNPVPSSEWISANGSLQSFVIVDGRERLKRVWAYQEEVLLRKNYEQCSIKITIFPTDDQNQGYIDYTSDFEISSKVQSEGKTKLLPQLRFAFLQWLSSNN